MICYLYPKPILLLFSSDVPALLYYAQMPAMAIALFLGFYIFWNGKEVLLNRLLLLISLLFSVWTIATLIVWAGNDGGLMAFIWPFYNLILIFIAIFSIYFIYVFIEKKDIGWLLKIIFLALLAPILILATTKLNIGGFNIANCDAFDFEWLPLKTYSSALGALAMIWILVLLFKKYRTAKSDFKKQIVLMGLGIELFLFSFFGTEFLATYLTRIGILSDSGLELYGLFGMVIFMVYISVLVVRYGVFNVKLLAAQALIWGLVVLIGSQFFFIDFNNIIVVVMVSVTVLISVLFGIILIDSVKNEVKRKEQLQKMSTELASANDKLTKLDNAKSEFISIASHQLRTPLTAIKGFVSMLLEGSYGKVDSKQEDVLNKVYNSNTRLINLVEDLLNVSRMESGRMEFNLEKTDMKPLCKEVMDTFYIKAKDAKLTLEYKLVEGDIPKVLVDGTKMKEVVSNLVDNAIKYCPKGGVTLHLNAGKGSQFIEQNTPGKNHFGSEPKIQNKEVVRVIVSDTGIGIPQSELPYLFAKFSRGKDISRLNTGGTGLGLYVGKAIVEANGSRVWAESDGEGKGSRFIIEIPVEQDPEIIKKWS